MLRERELAVQLVGCFEGWSLITVACNHEPTWMASELARILGFATPLELLGVLAKRWYERCPAGAIHYLEHGDRRELIERLDRAHVVLAPDHRRRPIVLLSAVAVYELVSALDSAVARSFARHLREQVIPEFHAHERAATALERPLLSIDAVTIAGNRLEFEQRCFEAAVLERLLDRLERAGTIDADQLIAHRVVASEIALGARLVDFEEELAHGWMTPTQIAERWCDMTPLRVGRLIAHLGLKGSRAHSRAFLTKARGQQRTVLGYVYSPSAVALIERELRSRGLRRCTCAEDYEAELAQPQTPQAHTQAPQGGRR